MEKFYECKKMAEPIEVDGVNNLLLNAKPFTKLTEVLDSISFKDNAVEVININLDTIKNCVPQVLVLKDGGLSENSENVDAVILSQDLTMEEATSDDNLPLGTTVTKIKDNIKHYIPVMKCLICRKQFTKSIHFHAHMKKHQSLKKYKCNQCTQSYNKEVNFKIHMALHCIGTPICPICERKFQRAASLKAHLTIHEIEESFSCLHCKDEFDKEEELQQHLELHVDDIGDTIENDDPLKCAYCGYIFNDAEKYKKHLKLHAQANKILRSGKVNKRNCQRRIYSHKCNDCDKSFPKMCLLKRHQRTHTGEKPFLCTTCKRGFSQKSALIIHCNRHSGIKPHECMFCPSKFVQRSNLIAHLKKTHLCLDADDKVYKCSQCTCVFRKLSSLNGHVTRVHSDCHKNGDDIMSVIYQLKELDNSKQKTSITEGIAEQNEILPDDSGKCSNISLVKITDSSINGILRTYVIKQRTVGEHRWYMCSQCKKEFKKPSDLIRHIRIHTKEKPYKCPECDVKFAQKSTLNNHLATHNKNRFECVVCAKKFGTIRSLNVHLKKHDQSAVARKNHNYKCSTCLKTFDSLESANAHMKLHDVSDDNLIFSKVQEVNNILQPLLETDEGLISIPPPKPRIPLANLDGFKDRPFKCHLCNAAFGRGAHLKKHMAYHCSRKEFSCSLCTKQFATYSTWKEHYSYHTRTKKHRCSICNKSFLNASMLRRHLISHQLDKPYICPYCRGRFSTKENCRKHISRHKLKEVSVLPEQNISNIEPSTNNGTIINEIGFDSLVVDGIQNSPNQTGETSNFVSCPEHTETINKPISQDEDVPQMHIPEGRACFYNIDDILFLENAAVHGGMPLLKLQSSDITTLNQGPLLKDQNYIATPQSLIISLDAEANINAGELNSHLIFNELDISSQQNAEKLVTYSVNAYEPPTTTSVEANEFSEVLPIQISANPHKDIVILENATINHNTNQKVMNYFGDFIMPDFLDVQPTNCQEDAICICPRCNGKITSIASHVCEGEMNGTSATEEIIQFYQCGKNNTPAITVENSLLYKFSCSKCCKEFPDENRLRRHISAKHKYLVSHLCQYCQKEFKKKSDMDRHIRTHTGEKPFSCSKCDKAFAIKSTLMSHLQTHNPCDIKPFKCQVCNSQFSTRKSLKTHLHNHIENAPYRCELCGKTFKRRHNMATHMVLHERKVSKFNQKMKPIQFLQSFVYDTHDKINEEQINGVGSSEINLADADITTEELVDLEGNVDPDMISYNQEISFKIDDANILIQYEEGQSSIPDLDDNQLLLSEKKFQCSVCSKYYVSNSVLRKHQRTLHGRYN